MKTTLAWICGIGSWFVLVQLCELLADSIGVPVLIRFDEPQIVSNRYYEEEIDSSFTTFGLCISVIVLMCAARVGMAVFHRRLGGGVSEYGEIQFQAWLVGLAVMAVFGALLFLAFRDVYSDFGNFIRWILELGAAAGLFWAMRTWHDQRIARLETGKREDTAI